MKPIHLVIFITVLCMTRLYPAITTHNQLTIDGVFEEVKMINFQSRYVMKKGMINSLLLYPGLNIITVIPKKPVFTLTPGDFKNDQIFIIQNNSGANSIKIEPKFSSIPVNLFFISLGGISFLGSTDSFEYMANVGFRLAISELNKIKLAFSFLQICLSLSYPSVVGFTFGFDHNLKNFLGIDRDFFNWFTDLSIETADYSARISLSSGLSLRFFSLLSFNLGVNLNYFISSGIKENLKLNVGFFWMWETCFSFTSGLKNHDIKYFQSINSNI